MNDDQIIVRKGRKDDVPRVFELIYELAVYEKAPGEVTNSPEQLLEDGFGANPIFGLFVACKPNGEMVGMALYCTKYSTWKGPCLFLEDIIVTEDQRGRGVGAKLFEAVIGVAQQTGAGRMEWQVLNWNDSAIGFYKKYNAILDGEWLNGKFTFEQLQSFEIEGK